MIITELLLVVIFTTFACLPGGVREICSRTTRPAAALMTGRPNWAAAFCQFGISSGVFDVFLSSVLWVRKYRTSVSLYVWCKEEKGKSRERRHNRYLYTAVSFWLGATYPANNVLLRDPLRVISYFFSSSAAHSTTSFDSENISGPIVHF